MSPALTSLSSLGMVPGEGESRMPPEKFQCTVSDAEGNRCPVRHVPGVDGGTKERCPRHYRLWLRKSPNADVVESPYEGNLTERIIVCVDYGLARWVKSRAKAAGLSTGAWVRKQLQAMKDGGGK